ncbi:DUF1801 domain-containing protein [Planctellipticum variicoloris]|uniref:DUF1801 domain-containing protein n=1 Tax=Planctellipticum variicoloris TaxID=3064265 RepID=UPI0030134FE2|nr:DUF1801 domain-containing protein [Planctomycetaceae bacterium SH412]
MQSSAATVAEYLAELPADRRAALDTVRKVILTNLDDGYEEGMLYGMIGYYVPHRIYPAGYHCDPTQPLGLVCLASQKNYMSLYLSCVSDSDDGCSGQRENWFTEAWARTGKKLDMGKSCIRFRRVEDLALEVIGEVIRRFPVKTYIEYYESTLKANALRKSDQTKTRKTPKSTSRRSSKSS